jgi:DNA-directed RNA polymerase specialized sigma24 family protein
LDAQTRNETKGPLAAWTATQLRQATASARHHSHRGAARLGLSRSDREDLQQDILLTVWSRTRHYDPTRGAWSTFVSVIARHAVAECGRRGRASAMEVGDVDLDTVAQGSSVTLQDAVDLDASLDLAQASEDLPEPVGRTLRLITVKGDIGTAARTSPVSPATFYRSIPDVRFWLRASGLRPHARVHGNAAC